HTSSVSMQTGIGRAWYWGNITSGVDPSVAASGASSVFIPMDWVIEYETTTTRQAWLVLSDSIPEGTTGPPGRAVTPTSLYRSPSNRWPFRAPVLAQNGSIYGRPAAELANPSPPTWSRMDNTAAHFDGAII